MLLWSIIVRKIQSMTRNDEACVSSQDVSWPSPSHMLYLPWVIHAARQDAVVLFAKNMRARDRDARLANRGIRGTQTQKHISATWRSLKRVPRDRGYGSPPFDRTPDPSTSTRCDVTLTTQLTVSPRRTNTSFVQIASSNEKSHHIITWVVCVYSAKANAVCLEETNNFKHLLPNCKYPW